jgi:hypothetical protein
MRTGVFVVPLTQVTTYMNKVLMGGGYFRGLAVQSNAQILSSEHYHRHCSYCLECIVHK